MVTLLAIIALGFFLGMRHATDPDHVIAVTTIVARQRRVGAAALIGVLWGIGHTLTIVAVGGAIIVFGVAIPPRLGLTMELSVALMLILLGVANVTGIMRWITGTVTPVHVHAHRHGDYAHSHAHGEMPAAHGHAEENTPLARLGTPKDIAEAIINILASDWITGQSIMVDGGASLLSARGWSAAKARMAGTGSNSAGQID